MTLAGAAPLDSFLVMIHRENVSSYLTAENDIDMVTRCLPAAETARGQMEQSGAGINMAGEDALEYWGPEWV